MPRSATLPTPAPSALLTPTPYCQSDDEDFVPVGLETPTSLESLVELALRRHPDLAAAEARANVARGKLIQAGLCPNPVMGPHFSDLGHKGRGLGDPGFDVSQTFVRGGKLELAQAAARHGVEAADWQALTRWFDVLTRVRLAYYELLAAQREREAMEQITRIAEESLEAARKLQKAGVGSEPDVLRAQVERDQNAIRQATAQRRVEAARRLLAATIGMPALPLDKIVGNLDMPAPELRWDDLRQMVLNQSSEIQEALALTRQADQQWLRAQAENVPNVDLAVRPFYSTPDRDFRVEVALAAPIPIWNQNQGNILTAQADRDRTRAEVKQVELRLTERLTAAFQRYQTARQQAEAYQKKILPQARESVRLVEIGYKNGDPKYNYTALLQAQQTLFQAQLTHVQALGELWRAVTEIGGLVQEENWASGKGLR